MAWTEQQHIKQFGEVDEDYTLEFRTWNGSAYVWTDYTERLVSFGEIGAEVEQSAYPNAFRIQLADIFLDNSDGFWNDIEVLDGLLHNASEPYGQSIYKRLFRLSVVRPSGTYPIAVGQVRDILLNTKDQQAIMQVTSLDARAADQNCDDIEAERHPLGSTSAASPSNWTKTQPASVTGEVAMYRWREEDEAEENVSMGFFRNRHYADAIERTAWALDDLATQITKTYRLMTSPDREIATVRNIPPDDPAVSLGVTPDRCRVVIWNPVRNVLVCCVGHKIYDYSPTTNVYTLRNTLTAGRDVVRAFYTTETDSGGVATRIVLVQCDINTYGSSSGGRVTTAWCTTLNASGSSAYSVLDSERSMGTDVFPGTHQFREGRDDGTDRIVGQYATGFTVAGENPHNPFRQAIKWMATGGASPPNDIIHESVDEGPSGHAPASLFDGGDPEFPVAVSPQTFSRGFMAVNHDDKTQEMGLRWTYGGFFACSLNIYAAGGRLYYFIWDSTNKYRMTYIDLNTYTAGGLSALGGANTRVPYFAYSPQDATYKRRLYVCQMQWKDTATDYSIGELYYYDFVAVAWSQVTFLSGATGNNQAWMVMECVHHTGAGLTLAGVLFNRETLKWRFCYDVIGGQTWASTDAACLATFLNGVKDQPSRLEGLYENTNYTPDKLFFVEAGPNLLWSYSSVLNKENVTPATATTPDPINSDRGIGSYFTSTGVNYPDSSTPNGILFWISAADYIDAGTDHPESGEYVLCQYANFDPGFIDLLDVKGKSFWALRSEIATAKGFVHFYAPNGTLVFAPRETSGAASFAFSKANKNYTSARLRNRGYEAIVNVVTVQPWKVVVDDRQGSITKGYNEADSSGTADYVVAGDPGENATWRLVFVSATTYDLFKLTGSGASATTPEVPGQSINSPMRTPANGLYLQIMPEHFKGRFAIDDTFTFTVFRPQESLEQSDNFFDRARDDDATSIAKYRRRFYSLSDNRFIRRQVAGDHANNLLTWRKVRHEVVDLQVASDPAYQPLLRCTLSDTENGLDGTYQIMGIRYRHRKESTLMLVKV